MTRSIQHSRLLLIAILALGCCGVWLSGELLKQHDDLWGRGAAPGLLARMCEVTQQWGFTCASSAKGPWANVRLPMLAWSGRPHAHLVTLDVPIAFVSLAYFVFVIVWFAFIGRPRTYGRAWLLVPLAVAAIGACASTTYLAIMALKIAPWCVACVALHTINFMMIAAIALLCLRRFCPATEANEATSLPPYRSARRTITPREAIGAVAFSLILAAGLWEYRGEHLALRDQWRKLLPYKTLVNELRNDRAFLLREYYAEPLQTTDAVNSRNPSQTPCGTGLQPVQSQDLAMNTGTLCDNQPRLDIFLDYDCPSCACRTSGVIEQARAAFGDQLQVAIRHYPLCQDCNPAVKTAFHRTACLAAYAAEAARLQGGDETFWKMHNRLLRYPGELKTEALCEIAAQIGMNRDRFLADLQSDAVRNVVASHVTMGRQWGVTGTPTLFINGRRVNQSFEGPAYWQAVAADWSSSRGEETASASSFITGTPVEPVPLLVWDRLPAGRISGILDGLLVAGKE